MTPKDAILFKIVRTCAMTPKAAILFKIVHTCAKECLILKYKYVQNPWHNWVAQSFCQIFLERPSCPDVPKSWIAMFFSLPNYTRSSRPSLLLKMKIRTRVPRRQTILVFSTLESAVQSLYSQKATWRYGNLLIHSPNRHLREGDGKVTLFYGDSKTTWTWH